MDQKPQPNPAELGPALSQIDSLRAGRMEMAQRTSELQMRRAFSINQIERPHNIVTNVPDNGYHFDAGKVFAADVIGLEAIGVPVRDLANKLSQDPDIGKEPVATARVEDEVLSIFRLRQGITITLDKENYEPDIYNPGRADKMTKLVSHRFAQSPGHRELARISRELEATPTLPDEISTQPFNPQEDPIGTLAFLDDIGLKPFEYALLSELRAGVSLDDLVARRLNQDFPSNIRQSETENTRIFEWSDEHNRGATRTLFIDKRTGVFTYAAKANPEHNYPEKANQTAYESEPFIETACAEQLFATLDKVGLMLHPSVQYDMMRQDPSTRYGSTYTEISREIAKWVNRPERTRVSNLIVPKDPQYLGTAITDNNDPELFARFYDVDVEATVLEALNTADLSTDNLPAQVLLTMVDDVVHRDLATVKTDLPVTSADIGMKDGSCFDVAGYYVGAAGTTALGRQDLRMTNHNNIPLLEKLDGANTFLTTEPITFNGVRLPKGSLFTHAKDGNWGVMRITPFAFDSPEDQRAFGSEITKMYEQETAAIRRIGGVSLQNLVDQV